MEINRDEIAQKLIEIAAFDTQTIGFIPCKGEVTTQDAIQIGFMACFMQFDAWLKPKLSRRISR